MVSTFWELISSIINREIRPIKSHLPLSPGESFVSFPVFCPSNNHEVMICKLILSFYFLIQTSQHILCICGLPHPDIPLGLHPQPPHLVTATELSSSVSFWRSLIIATSNSPDHLTIEEPAQQMNHNQGKSLGPRTIMYMIFSLSANHNFPSLDYFEFSLLH